MLPVGLIGLGRDWENRHRPALQALQKRLRVVSVYTPVFARAISTAREFDCEAAPGLYAMMERPDIRAVLVLEGGWWVEPLFRWAADFGRPVYLSRRAGDYLESCAAWLRASGEDSPVLVPEFPLRYTAATSRLRELIASRLGTPRRITVESHVAADTLQLSAPGLVWATHEPLADVLDWCSSFAPAPLAAIQTQRNGSLNEGDLSLADRHITLQFRSPRGTGAVCTAEICFRPIAASNGVDLTASAPSMNCRVECDRGVAEFKQFDAISWTQGSHTESEKLTSDRSETELLLDHFSRRVAGGLIPVPTVDDVRQAWKLVCAVLQASDSGELFEWRDDGEPAR
jgi:predicted dehydrogenase